MSPNTINHGVILGKRCTPQDALAYGFVHHICAPDRLVDKAKMVAKEIIKLRPLRRDTLRKTKEAFYGSVITIQKNIDLAQLASKFGDYSAIRDSQIQRKKSKI